LLRLETEGQVALLHHALQQQLRAANATESAAEHCSTLSNMRIVRPAVAGF
jgi:hypothetical protein